VDSARLQAAESEPPTEAGTSGVERGLPPLGGLNGPGLARMDAASQTRLAVQLQRGIGNRATARLLARQATKEKPPPVQWRTNDPDRAKDPVKYVMHAVNGMKAGHSWEDRVVEIVWRMLFVYLPDRVRAGVYVTPAGKGPSARDDRMTAPMVIEPAKDPPPEKDAELLVGQKFVDGITEANLDVHVETLRLIFLGQSALSSQVRADYGMLTRDNLTRSWSAGELAMTVAGLRKIPSADRDSLANVTLERDDIPSSSGLPPGWIEAGHFKGDLASGATTRDDRLRMFDEAFVNGPGPAAQVLAHEVAHAIASKKTRDASLKVNQTVGDQAANRQAWQELNAAMSGNVSRRLADFMRVVNQRRIAPVTAYAATGDEEFFAEAYSMWLNDPKQLAQKAPDLTRYFDEGKHRN
jgi:Glucose-regulated metallo-peptidase M90